MKKFGNKIEKIMKIEVETYSIKLKFSDGFVGTVSLRNIFTHPKGLASEVLRGNLFSQCFIDTGALAWPNGLEFCPDAIRTWIQEQSKKVA